MKNKTNHTHKYRRVNIGRNGKDYLVYRCIKPGCSHYVPVHLSLGKLCECNRCGNSMVISKVVLNSSGGRSMARPHCDNCIERKKRPDVAAITEFLGTKTG